MLWIRYLLEWDDFESGEETCLFKDRFRLTATGEIRNARKSRFAFGEPRKSARAICQA